uniref:Uncharacterized protein n=1 Tax=Solanum tuberosum TaxID=4113 RepID=M1DGS5_SOLTU
MCTDLHAWELVLWIPQGGIVMMNGSDPSLVPEVKGWNSELNLLYIEGFNDYECLGKEPWMLRGFRVGETKEKSWIFGGKGWGVAPASAPQQGF